MSVPDLIKLQQIPVNLDQMVETSLLETSTFREATINQPGIATFNVEKKGFLSSQSKLFVSILPEAQTATSFVPQNIGIASVLQRAVLKVDNAVLNEISDWNHLHLIKSAQIDNENNKEREQYTTGRMWNLEYDYRSVQQPGGAGNLFNIRSENVSSKSILDNGKEPTSVTVGPSLYEGWNGEVKPFSKMTNTTHAESPVYSIELSDIFPFLKTHSLPLYLIDGQLTIELHWAPLGQRAQVTAGATDNTDALKSWTIDKNELNFCADYIFYQGTQMQAYADANPVIEFSFPDYRLSKTTVTQAELTSGVVRNVGMANRLVSRVLTTLTRKEDEERLSLQGVNNAQAPGGAAGGTAAQGEIRYNVRYNDRFQFPIDITNPAQLFTHLTRSEGLPFLTREQYSNEQGGLSQDATFEGHILSDNCAGKSQILGTRLTRGRVGTRGIEVHLTSAVPAGTYDMRTWSEYGRLAVLDQGRFNVYNA